MERLRCENCGWEGSARELYLPLWCSEPGDLRCHYCYEGMHQIIDLDEEEEGRRALQAHDTTPRES